jgi:hypothetical protein
MGVDADALAEMKKMLFSVEVDRRGRPIWRTLEVSIRIAKEDRKYKRAGRTKGRWRGAARAQ